MNDPSERPKVMKPYDVAGGEVLYALASHLDILAVDDPFSHRPVGRASVPLAGLYVGHAGSVSRPRSAVRSSLLWLVDSPQDGGELRARERVASPEYARLLRRSRVARDKAKVGYEHDSLCVPRVSGDVGIGSFLRGGL